VNGGALLCSPCARSSSSSVIDGQWQHPSFLPRIIAIDPSTPLALLVLEQPRTLNDVAGFPARARTALLALPATSPAYTVYQLALAAAAAARLKRFF